MPEGRQKKLTWLGSKVWGDNTGGKTKKGGGGKGVKKIGRKRRTGQKVKCDILTNDVGGGKLEPVKERK